jgi:hypothetical protein
MDARRGRILIVTILSGGLLTLLWAASSTAASCTLSAPASVQVGQTFALVGSGFPASSSVSISMTVEGSAPIVFPKHVDTTGAFQVSLTPGASDTGKMTIVATAGTVCTEHVTVTVGTSKGASTPAPTKAIAAATPKTAATPAPSHALAATNPKAAATPTPSHARAAATPRGAVAGATGAPPTDAMSDGSGKPDAPLTAWLVSGLLVVLGLGGLIATRSARNP